MLWAQITLVVYFGLTLLASAAQHGRSSVTNFRDTAIIMAIVITLVYLAGGFSHFAIR